MRTHDIYLSLGSNLGDSREHLQKARIGIEALPNLVLKQASPIYLTNPQDLTDQPDFLNQVLLLQCTEPWTPPSLWQALASLETDLGRVRLATQRFGARSIDIDILLFDDCVCNTKNLVLPHPRLYQRAFVLVPLADINPHVQIPYKDSFATPKALLSKLDYSILGSILGERIIQNP